jgi:hypothetical protein
MNIVYFVKIIIIIIILVHKKEIFEFGSSSSIISLSPPPLTNLSLSYIFSLFSYLKSFSLFETLTMQVKDSEFGFCTFKKSPIFKQKLIKRKY